ncbi:MAG: efflux transporter outer membrane subunit, partial [Burkholderiales bacterium]|nr:efflux transporter outer membrane subunit [Burkholderiales bacterium]
AGAWQRAGAAPAVPDAWWTLYGDPVLDGLEQRLLTGNQTLRVSLAQVASARAAYDASLKAFFPTLGANAAYTRSGNPVATSALAPSGRATASAASLALSSSWETDLWGKLQLARGGARATLQASADQLASARLSAQALLVQSYFSLRTSQAQIALYRRSVEAYQKALELTQARHAGGVAAGTDVLAARTQLATARAQLEALIAQHGQTGHAIAVLLGEPPAALRIPDSPRLPAVPEVPPMLPAQLLERRPDIAAAQRQVAAAYAQIGIADAAFFPDLTLSASAGFRAGGLAGLLTAPNRFWSLGPALTQAIFDGGARKLASAQARAAADVATANYRQVVLTSLQEVEDNLLLARQLALQAGHEQEALDAARQNLALTLEQYRAGVVDYLNVISAQTAALAAENTLLQVRNSQLAAVNTLLKNIAGRWEPA